MNNTKSGEPRKTYALGLKRGNLVQMLDRIKEKQVKEILSTEPTGPFDLDYWTNTGQLELLRLSNDGIELKVKFRPEEEILDFVSRRKANQSKGGLNER